MLFLGEKEYTFSQLTFLSPAGEKRKKKRALIVIYQQLTFPCIGTLFLHLGP